MSSKPPQPKRLQPQPGESPWADMARELAANPDSPTSLQIMSAVSHALAPRQKAIDQVVSALEEHLKHPGEQQEAAVQASIQYWEREFAESMTSEMLEDLRKEARTRFEHRRRQPPPMNAILESMPTSTDTGYDLGVHLVGLKGTWHRLWAIIALTHSMEGDVDVDVCVQAVKAQFEELLGRSMKAVEWNALREHAVNHAETGMSPGI